MTAADLVQNYALSRDRQHLGDMYREGLGVPQDFVEAHRWYNLAASWLTGDQREEAATDRDAVAEQMTPVDLSEAQRRAREWHAAQPGPLTAAGCPDIPRQTQMRPLRKPLPAQQHPPPKQPG